MERPPVFERDALPWEENDHGSISGRGVPPNIPGGGVAGGGQAPSEPDPPPAEILLVTFSGGLY